jgi:hypothetical protein
VSTPHAPATFAATAQLFGVCARVQRPAAEARAGAAWALPDPLLPGRAPSVVGR